MKKTKTTPYDVSDHLRNSKESSAYLEAVLSEFDGDMKIVIDALQAIAKNKGLKMSISEELTFQDFLRIIKQLNLKIQIKDRT